MSAFDPKRTLAVTPSRATDGPSEAVDLIARASPELVKSYKKVAVYREGTKDDSIGFVACGYGRAIAGATSETNASNGASSGQAIPITPR